MTNKKQAMIRLDNNTIPKPPREESQFLNKNERTTFFLNKARELSGEFYKISCHLVNAYQKYCYSKIRFKAAHLPSKAHIGFTLCSDKRDYEELLLNAKESLEIYRNFLNIYRNLVSNKDVVNEYEKKLDEDCTNTRLLFSNIFNEIVNEFFKSPLNNLSPEIIPSCREPMNVFEKCDYHTNEKTMQYGMSSAMLHLES